MTDETRRRFNLLERRIERLEKLVGPVDDPLINSGDWLNLEGICLGDIIGGIEIRSQQQVDILNKAGEEIKKLDCI